MPDSIFTKIIKGEIPSFKVYEDNQTLAFLDIYPIQPGHTLVIPKVQVATLWDLDNEVYEYVMKTTKKVAVRLKEVLNTPYVGVQVVGLDVPHAHIHLVPFSTMEEFRTIPDESIEPDYDQLKKLSQNLYF